LNPLLRNDQVQRAAEELRSRTLSQFSRPLDCLVYLASTRDYNTGVYYHDGLASKFGEEVACEALAECHREVFQQLLSSSLEGLVSQMESYMRTTGPMPTDFLAMWKGLEPYRVTVPVGGDPLSTEFLFSNFRIALAILDERLRARRQEEPGASPRLSLVR
jgi:hypothetical protein